MSLRVGASALGMTPVDVGDLQPEWSILRVKENMRRLRTPSASDCMKAGPRFFNLGKVRMVSFWSLRLELPKSNWLPKGGYIKTDLMSRFGHWRLWCFQYDATRRNRRGLVIGIHSWSLDRVLVGQDFTGHLLSD